MPDPDATAVLTVEFANACPPPVTRSCPTDHSPADHSPADHHPADHHPADPSTANPSTADPRLRTALYVALARAGLQWEESGTDQAPAGILRVPLPAAASPERIRDLLAEVLAETAPNGYPRLRLRFEGRQAAPTATQLETAPSGDTRPDDSARTPRPRPRDPWQVCVGPGTGTRCGPGLLVSGRHIVTCRHLVPGGRSAPFGVRVTFDGAIVPGSQRRAVVVGWEEITVPPLGCGGAMPGLAILRTPSDLPLGAVSAPLTRFGDRSTNRCLVVLDRQAVAAVAVGAADSDGEVVWLDYPDRGRRGEQPGICPRPGSAVVDPVTNNVVGLLLTCGCTAVAQRPAMATTDAIAAHWPSLAAMLTPEPEPQRTISLVDFALAVAALPTVATRDDRDRLVDRLSAVRPDIMVRHRYAERRFDVTSMVRTCRRHRNGLATLITVLRQFEGDGERMRQIEHLHSLLADAGGRIPRRGDTSPQCT